MRAWAPAAALLAVVALPAGCGGEPSAGRPAGTATGTRQASPAPAPAPSVVQRIGQSIVLSFEGTTVPEYVHRALRERRAAGVILFSDNVSSPAQLRAMTRGLQRSARGAALVMADQEGGPVRVISFAGPALGQAAQSTREQAAAQARSAGRELRRLGVNVNLAPVADLPSVAGAALSGRAFTGDGATVAARVQAAVRGYRATGVGATVKHFPGLGAATVNTDDGPATIPRLGPGELEPFTAAVKAGVPLVMASHALYPGMDSTRIASQSPPILGDLLRRRLAFRGVVITDSMEADAVLRRSALTTAAERSLMAGADLLLLTGDGSFRPVSQHLRALAHRSSQARRRLAEANARVEALRGRLRLRPAFGR